VQTVDLEQLADVATTGGIAALEELAATGKVATPTEPTTAEEPKDEDAVAAAKAEEPAATPEVPATTEPETKEHATAVSTKDGKGTIPYSVLKGARERATQVEQQNEVLRTQLAELTQRRDSNTTTVAETKAATGEVDDQITAMQAKVEQLKDEFPELAELMNGQITMLQATRQQLVDLQTQQASERATREADDQAKVQETLQEAIDGNPALTLWQSKNGPEWQAAVDMDAMLRAKPEWAEKTFADRFEKVVELVRVMNPEYEVPATAAKDTPPVVEATSTTKDTQAPASDKRPPVNSLSDIPGGVPPAAGKREQLEELSGSALGNRFMNLSQDALLAELAALGN
jgi:hypothetical protein